MGRTRWTGQRLRFFCARQRFFGWDRAARGAQVLLPGLGGVESNGASIAGHYITRGSECVLEVGSDGIYVDIVPAFRWSALDPSGGVGI